MRSLGLVIALAPLATLAHLAERAEARPVSYRGGWSLMSENRPYQSEAMVAYTPTRRLALGLHGADYRWANEAEAYFAAPVVNALLTRWNEEGLQANVYLGGGYGLVRTRDDERDDDERGAPVLLIDADAETRSHYVSVRYERVYTESPEPLAYARARFGFSPYLAEFGGLHTWVIVQGDYDQWRKRGEVTPLLRFFFQNVLWEIGSSLRGAFQLNWTVEI